MSDLRGQDVIDSRDVIARLEELEEALLTCQHCGEDFLLPFEPDHRMQNFTEGDCPKCGGEVMEEDERAELGQLEALKNECEDYGDWNFGATLINEMYFTEYCMEMLKDIGDLPRDIPSYIAIDEDQTAENLKVDYTTVDFNGDDYYIRNC